MRTLKLGGLGRSVSPPSPAPPPPPILAYITSRYAYMKLLFCWQLIPIFLYKLGVQANYPLAWIFFFRTLATAFPTSYCMKNICFCWVWKSSNDVCPLNQIRSASFLTGSDWLKKKTDQLLCVRKEALRTRLKPT